MRPTETERRRLATAPTIAALLVMIVGCQQEEDPAPIVASPSGTATPRTVPAVGSATLCPTFVDVAGSVGLDFVHQGDTAVEYFVPAISGGGAAVFDYDNDGDLDIYLINGGDWTPGNPQPGTATNRLFRQEADGRFRDVTAESGLGDTGLGIGCAVGDIDNDGDVDVYVTNYGPDRLFLNNGDGSFIDASARYGVDHDRWTTSAAFLDYDRDGWLDLYVAAYVAYDASKKCPDAAGRRDFCGPDAFEGVADILYHNEGNAGRFDDVTAEAGLSLVRDSGLGVVCADFNDDGWIDVYVANDGDANNLWINQGDGTFVDEAVPLGVAYNRYGVAEAGMGVTAGDADGDGDLDLFIAHLSGETNTLYRNMGALGFDDDTVAANLARSSLNLTGFGTAFFDADNDGDLDLAVLNGAVKRRPGRPEVADGTSWRDYVEPNLLFINSGSGTFEDVSAEAGPLCSKLYLSRSLVPADFNGDGSIDLLVTNIDGPVQLFYNKGGACGNWIAIRPRLHGRDALGAKVTIVTKHDRYVRHAIPPGGYLSSAGATIHLGIGQADSIIRFEVRWPDGAREVFPGCPAGRYIELRRGEGEVPPDRT